MVPPAARTVTVAATAPRREPLRTEFAFELPRGYVDDAGTVHRAGSCAWPPPGTSWCPLRDDRVRENPAYLTVVLLARVITRIGTGHRRARRGHRGTCSPSDLAFLQDLYRRINSEGHTRAAVACPECEHRFAVDLAGGRLGES